MLWRWRWKVTVEAFLFYFSWTAASLPLESSHLKYCKEPLSDLSPIDHSSRQSHKSPLLPLQMELCQLHNTNGIQAEKKNKKLRTRCCVKRYPPLSIPCIRSLLIWSFLSPGGTYSVPDVHYPPPPPNPFCRFSLPTSTPTPVLLHVTWDRPGAEFWVISRSHPTPSIAAPFWGEGKWQHRLSRAELPSWVDQRSENRLWIVIRAFITKPLTTHFFLCNQMPLVIFTRCII